VLLALPGMSEIRVDQLLTLRLGPDGIANTEDDTVFNSIDEIAIGLGLSPEQFKQLQASGLVGFNDPVLRVESIGKSGAVTRTVRMVIRKVGISIQLLTWKEL
jgi:hypothetical protein